MASKPKPKPRTPAQVLAAIGKVTARIIAKEAELADLYEQRTDLYCEGRAADLTRETMAEAAGVTAPAVTKAILKRDAA